jgi:transposase
VTGTAPAEQVVKDIRRAARKLHSSEEKIRLPRRRSGFRGEDPASEEKIRIVLSGLRGEESIAELCRKEGIAQSLYYSWSKEFLEAGKKRLAGDTARQANTGEVKDLRAGALALKDLVADLSLENRLLKKT